MNPYTTYYELIITVACICSVLVVLALLAGGSFLFYRRRNRPKQE